MRTQYLSSTTHNQKITNPDNLVIDTSNQYNTPPPHYNPSTTLAMNHPSNKEVVTVSSSHPMTVKATTNATLSAASEDVDAQDVSTLLVLSAAIDGEDTSVIVPEGIPERYDTNTKSSTFKNNGTNEVQQPDQDSCDAVPAAALSQQQLQQDPAENTIEIKVHTPKNNKPYASNKNVDINGAYIDIQQVPLTYQASDQHMVSAYHYQCLDQLVLCRIEDNTSSSSKQKGFNRAANFSNQKYALGYGGVMCRHCAKYVPQRKARCFYSSNLRYVFVLFIFKF